LLVDGELIGRASSLVLVLGLAEALVLGPLDLSQ